jgi:hypothetical protein
MRSKLEKIINQPIPEISEYAKMSYRPTSQKAYRIYHMLNEVIFENELSPCRLIVRDLRGVWGYAHAMIHNYKFKTYIELTHKYPCEQFFVAVVGHEMVHQWQWEVVEPTRNKKKYLAGHGKVFYKWKKKFNEHGIPFGEHIPCYYS